MKELNQVYNLIIIIIYVHGEDAITKHFVIKTHAIGSLNFIRLLRVVITPSVERRKRLEAIG